MKIITIKNALSSQAGIYAVLLIAFAFNLSSHTFAFWPGDNWWLRSAYWLLYLSLSVSFIFGFYFLLEKVSLTFSKQILFGLAIIISWLPFGLAISMVDIATSRPATSYAIRELHSTGFLPTLISSMAINILPRHLIFGTLVYLIRFHVNVGASKEEDSNAFTEESINSDETNWKTHSGFMSKLAENMKAPPQLLQAQEHYLSVTTTQGQQLILYKFGQAIGEIPENYGIQVHRSFWVANNNIRGWTSTDNGLKITLHHGEETPVSRRFEHHIKKHFSKLAL